MIKNVPNFFKYCLPKWLNYLGNMKRIIVILVFIGLSQIGFSQAINKVTLPQCYTWAKEIFPLMKQQGVVEKLTNLKLEQIDLQSRPTISWNAQITGQSEAISLALPIPNFEPVDLPLVRGQTTLDANYTIYDGGMLDAQKKIQTADLKVQQQQIEVEFEKVKPQITKAFLGVGLLRQRISILEQGIKSIENKKKQLEVGVANGVVLPSTVKRLQVEILKLESSIQETEGDINTLFKILEAWTGKEFDKNTVLILPEATAEILLKKGNFPEYELFELQKQQILVKGNLLDAKEKPKVGAFVQAGVGYPNPLNFFDNSISPFAVGGVKFQWTFFDWGMTDKERQMLSVSTQTIDIQKEAFEKSLSIADERYKAEIEKIEKLLPKDREIIALYDDIIKEMDFQLENGVITSTDYVNQLNEQLQAKLQLKLHEVQIEQKRVEYLQHKGLL